MPAAASEELRARMRPFVRRWVVARQGSAAELLSAVESEFGWPARLELHPVLDELRASRDHPNLDRKYLLYTLNAAALKDALANGLPPHAQHQSCLDELFGRSRKYRRTKKFAEAVEFVSKFREYSPFNNMLVFLQNPHATFFATANAWKKQFGRSIQDEARGMIILAPRTPVLLLYDVAETQGPPLPQKLELFSKTAGKFNPTLLDRTMKNGERDRILVERKPMGPLKGGYSTSRVQSGPWRMRIVLREGLEAPAAYAVLCHELAHIYLGHLGADKKGGWPYRQNLSNSVAEVEAESVAHIVCRRAGLRTHSAEYLATYVEESDDLDYISLDLVSRAAARIEEMGRRLLAPREIPGSMDDTTNA